MSATMATTRERRGFRFGRKEDVQNNISTAKMEEDDITMMTSTSMEEDEEMLDLLSPSTRHSIRQLSLQAQELMESVREITPPPSPVQAPVVAAAADSSFLSLPPTSSMYHPSKEEEHDMNKHKNNLLEEPVSTSRANVIPLEDSQTLATIEDDHQTSITRVDKNSNEEENEHDEKNDDNHITTTTTTINNDDCDDYDDDSIHEELNNLTSLEEQLRQDLSNQNMDSMKRELRMFSPPQPYKYSSESTVKTSILPDQQEQLLLMKQQQQQQKEDEEDQLPLWWLIVPLIVAYGMMRYMDSSMHTRGMVVGVAPGQEQPDSVLWL